MLVLSEKRWEHLVYQVTLSIRFEAHLLILQTSCLIIKYSSWVPPE